MITCLITCLISWITGAYIIDVVSGSVIPELESLNFDEVNNETGRDIGWIKAISCTESHGLSSFTYHSDIETIAPYALAIKIVPSGSTTNANYTSFAVTTKICSNPVLALNKNKEVSYTIHPNTGYLEGFASLDYWIGSQVAKSRLTNTCFGSGLQLGAYGNDISDALYQACGFVDGIHIVQKEGWCEWEFNQMYGEDIEVYFGYDLNKTDECDIGIHSVPLNYKHNEVQNITDKLKHIEYDEVTSVDGYDIGWIKLMSCNEAIWENGRNTKSKFTLREGYNLDAIRDLLSYVISMRISGNNQTNPNHDDFVLETVPCSNPVFAINNKKETSWYLNEFTHKYAISDYLFSDNWHNLPYWMGSSTAKDKLQTDGECALYRENGEPRDFPAIYHGCTQKLDVDMNTQKCRWSKANKYGQDIDIYFGFDKHKENICEFELEQMNVTHSDNFIFVPYELNGLDAEMFCERNFNTTLAVVDTEDKIMEAVELRYLMGYEDSNAWIGLYSPLNLNWIHWQWYGSTHSCNFGECWFNDFPNNGNFHPVDKMNTTKYGCAFLVDSSDLTVFPDSAFSTLRYGGCQTFWESGKPHTLPFLCDRYNEISLETEQKSCNFFHKESVNISRYEFEVFNYNFTIGSEMKISFDIKLDPNFVCNATRCNILHVGNDLATKIPSIYIVGDDIEVFMFNGGWGFNVDQYSHKIYNGLHLLNNGEYHHIEFQISSQLRKYIIDGVTYFFSTGIQSSGPQFTFLKYIGKTYQMFISNPWEQSVDGTMKNLCIESNYDPHTIHWKRLEHITHSYVYRTKSVRTRWSDYSLPIAYYNEQLIIITQSDFYYRYFPETSLRSFATDRSSASLTLRNLNTADTNITNVLRPANDSFIYHAQLKTYIALKDIERIPPIIMHSQQFIQDDDTLYVLVENNSDPRGFEPISNSSDIILTSDIFNITNISTSAFHSTTNGIEFETTKVTQHNAQIYMFDLGELSLEKTIIIPQEYYYEDFAFDSCITTNHTHLFILNEGIIIYDIINKTFTHSNVDENDFNIIMVGCATDVDNGNIFIFGGLQILDDVSYNITDAVYEYDIISDSIQLLDGITLKHPTYAIRAIATANHNIYLNGGITNEDGARDQIRSIFNVKSRAFESYQYIDDKKGYFSSAIYDENTNLILRYLSTKHQVDLLVVDPLSIDFCVTEINMWRSDVWLDYIIHDYTIKNEASVYKFQLNYANTTDNITKLMVIDEQDSIDDICYLCDDMQWNEDCVKGCTIAIYDTSIDAINIEIASLNYNVEILYSDTLYIEFNKCVIHYEITPKSVRSGDRISVNYQMDTICYSNPLITDGYIANMYNKRAKINHDIVINILDDDSRECLLCEYDDHTQCEICHYGIKPFIDNTLEDKVGAFTIQITSNTTDLLIGSSSALIEISVESDDLTPLEVAGIVSGSSLVGLCICGLLGCCYWKHLQLKAEQKRQKEHKHDINNPLVLMIGIAEYNYNVPKPGVNAICPDLDGVDVDYMKVKKLCQLLNYDLFPPQAKLNWSQQEIMDILQETAEKMNYSLSSEEPYDSMLVICSSHGLKNSIITSDYQAFDKDAVHRIFGANYPEIRKLPRIFMFDCCDGNQERSYMPADYDDDDDDDESVRKGKEKGKNVNPADVIFTPNAEMWKSDQLNPDYKLVMIHGANVGFKAKIDSVYGSHLISSFIGKMKQNIEEEKNLFLGDIMEDIQNELQSKGKQQSVNIFNNHTRYLRFHKKTIMNNMCVEKESEVKVEDNYESDKQQSKHINSTIGETDNVEMVGVCDSDNGSKCENTVNSIQ